MKIKIALWYYCVSSSEWQRSRSPDQKKKKSWQYGTGMGMGKAATHTTSTEGNLGTAIKIVNTYILWSTNYIKLPYKISHVDETSYAQK